MRSSEKSGQVIDVWVYLTGSDQLLVAFLDCRVAAVERGPYAVPTTQSAAQNEGSSRQIATEQSTASPSPGRDRTPGHITEVDATTFQRSIAATADAAEVRKVLGPPDRSRSFEKEEGTIDVWVYVTPIDQLLVAFVDGQLATIERRPHSSTSATREVGA